MSLKERVSKIISHPAGYLLLYIVVFGIILAIGRSSKDWVLSLENYRIPLIIASSTVAFLIAIGIIVFTYRILHLANYPKRSLLLALIPVIILFVLTMFAVRSMPSSAPLIMLNGIFLILLAFLIGDLLSKEVMNPGHLLPVAVVLALVDFWSVHQGPSNEIVKQVSEFAQNEGYAGEIAPPFASFLLFRFPQFLTDEIYSFLGVSDLVILAFFIGCIHRFGLPVIQSYATLMISPVIAVLTANIIEKGVPALPVIALLFIFVNFKHLKMNKKDMIQAVVVILVVILAMFLVRFFR